METTKLLEAETKAVTAVNIKEPFAPNDDNVEFAATVVRHLSKLKEKRLTWETTVYAKSNDGLYDLLAKCLELFNDKYLTASNEDRKTLRTEVATLLKTDGVKVQRNTTTLTMFVRFVFGSDRKRAHGYAYVLKAAITFDISAPKLKDFILNNGGIEEIKRKMVVSEAAKSNKQKREDLVNALYKRIAKDNLVKKGEEEAIETETATLKAGTASNDTLKTKELLAA